jgi:hypothetical protein
MTIYSGNLGEAEVSEVLWYLGRLGTYVNKEIDIWLMLEIFEDTDVGGVSEVWRVRGQFSCLGQQLVWLQSLSFLRLNDSSWPQCKSVRFYPKMAVFWAERLQNKRVSGVFPQVWMKKESGTAYCRVKEYGPVLSKLRVVAVYVTHLLTKSCVLGTGFQKFQTFTMHESTVDHEWF